MEDLQIAIIGAGGHGCVVASTIIAAGYKVAGFYDDDQQKWGSYIFDIPVIGATSKLKSQSNPYAIIGIGDNNIRKQLSQQLDLNWISVVHPFSWVHPEVKIGVGTVICAGAIVQPGATIGSHVILNTKASVDHDCQVGDYVHIAVSHLAGGASADEGAFLALGSTVLPGVHIGSWATVGAGSIVTKDVSPGITVVGTPARAVKSNRRK